MTSLRERLEKKIESASQDWQDQGCFKGQLIIENARTRWASNDFKAGANSMLDLVCELAEALEFYASINVNEPSAALAVDKFGMARKALNAIEEFVGDEE